MISPTEWLDALEEKAELNSMEIWNIIEALRGHATWLRNYAKDPKKYHNPVPMTPDELDRIAQRLSKLVPRS